MTLLFFDLGSGEIFLIVLAIFLVFGPGKIPELARTLGKFISEIKRASEDVKTEINREADRLERDKKLEKYKLEMKNPKPDITGEPENGAPIPSALGEETEVQIINDTDKENADSNPKTANNDDLPKETISIKPDGNTVTTKR